MAYLIYDRTLTSFLRLIHPTHTKYETDDDDGGGKMLCFQTKTNLTLK